MKMRVVVGIGDRNFGAPLQWAVEELYSSGASLQLVHCIAGRLPTEMPYSNDEAFLDGRRILNDAVSYANEWGASADAELREGYAGELLVEYSKSADLLVIGRHRRRRFVRPYRQSVVKYCVRHVECPLTIVSDGGIEHFNRKSA